MTNQEFKSCFDQYFDPIRNYIYYRSGDADLATDIAQDVFMKVWEKQFKDLKYIKGLLYKMASDQFVSHLRKQKVADAYVSTLDFREKADAPDQDLHYQELKQQYENTLRALPEKQRVVFLMNRMDGLTYKEIAIRLDVSQKTIEKRMSQTLSTLRKVMKGLSIIIGLGIIVSLGSCQKECNQTNPQVNCVCNRIYQPVCGCNN